jgi:hypothetical protein
MGMTGPSSSLTVSLSGAVAEFVRAQVMAEGCSDATEYIERLVYDRQRQQTLAPLESQLLEGLNSSDIEATDQFWADIEREAAQKISRGDSR